MKIQRFPFLMLVFSSAVATHAFGEEPSAPGLPGVKPQKPIVSAPPPEPDRQPAGTWKNFRVGNTEVFISGDITIDVSTGGLPPSGR